MAISRHLSCKGQSPPAGGRGLRMPYEDRRSRELNPPSRFEPAFSSHARLLHKMFVTVKRVLNLGILYFQ
jgi:hypothetical protein